MNAPRAPSTALVNCDSNDVTKGGKNQRKNRVLVQLPGLVAPLGAGPIGSLEDMNTQEPKLYLDMRDGRRLMMTVGRKLLLPTAYLSHLADTWRSRIAQPTAAPASSPSTSSAAASRE